MRENAQRKLAQKSINLKLPTQLLIRQSGDDNSKLQLFQRFSLTNLRFETLLQ